MRNRCPVSNFFSIWKTLLSIWKMVFTFNWQTGEAQCFNCEKICACAQQFQTSNNKQSIFIYEVIILKINFLQNNYEWMVMILHVICGLFSNVFVFLNIFFVKWFVYIFCQLRFAILLLMKCQNSQIGIFCQAKYGLVVDFFKIKIIVPSTQKQLFAVVNLSHLFF